MCLWELVGFRAPKPGVGDFVGEALAGIGTAGNAAFPGLGSILVVLSVVVLVALIGINTYSGMLTVITAVDSMRPITPTATLRAAGIATFSAVSLAGGLLLADSTATLEAILLGMLYLLTPWTAVNLTDYFLVRKGSYQLSDFFNPAGAYGMWSRPGLIAYGVGVLVQIPFFVLPFYTGPAAAALGGVDLSFVVGLVVSAGLYLLLTRSLSADSATAGVAHCPPIGPSAVGRPLE